MSAQISPNRHTKGHLRYVVGHEVNITDSINAYKLLGENQPVDNDFLSDPTFAIIGRNNSFYFSIGANLKFTSSYDWGNPLDNPSGMCPASLKHAQNGDDRLYQMTAHGSNIYVNVIGFPTSANQVGLFMSLNMSQESDGGYRVKANNIYMHYRWFTFGYTSSLYDDQAADPYTIDGHGPVASGSHSNIQVNWQRYVTRHLRIGVGLEAPKADYTCYLPKDNPELTSLIGRRQRVPDVPFYINYSFSPSSHLRLSSVLRTLTYRDIINNTNHTTTGWGIKLTGAITDGKVTGYGMVQGGRGIARYLQENQDLGLDMLPDEGHPGTLRLTGAWGCIVGVQYNWRPTLFSTVVYSYLRNYADPFENTDGISYADNLCYVNYAVANLIWQVTPLFRTGIEYVYGQRSSFSRDRISNNRISAMLTMSF